jgi:hypothetical protein
MNSERIDANTETPFRPPQIDIPQGVRLAAAPSLDQIRERFEAVRTNLMAGFDALTAQSQGLPVVSGLSRGTGQAVSS